METLALVFLLLSDIVYISSMFMRKKPILLIMVVISNALFAIQFLLLDALSGCLTIFTDILYLLAIYFLEKFNKEKFNIIPTIIALLLVSLFSILTWSGAISLLPLFALYASLTTTMFKQVVVVKIGSVVRNILFAIYILLTSSLLNFILQIVVVVGISIASFMELKLNNKS